MPINYVNLLGFLSEQIVSPSVLSLNQRSLVFIAKFCRILVAVCEFFVFSNLPQYNPHRKQVRYYMYTEQEQRWWWQRQHRPSGNHNTLIFFLRKQTRWKPYTANTSTNIAYSYSKVKLKDGYTVFEWGRRRDERKVQQRATYLVLQKSHLLLMGLSQSSFQLLKFL